MRLGVFARTFLRPTLNGVLDAIAEHGFHDVHFNLSCAGLESLPGRLTSGQCGAIRSAFTCRGLAMCGVSGTFNAIHPDESLRAELTRRACRLIERCHDLGTQFVSVCTGTRDPHDMWRGHVATREPASWDDLCGTLEILLAAAEKQNVYLGIEPEHSNVVNCAVVARRLLDHFRSPHLKIVLDAANLMCGGQLNRMRSVLDEAFDLLSAEIVMAHAKDYPKQIDGSLAVGEGLLDWDYYLCGLRRIGFTGPLVLHGMNEQGLASSLRFLEHLSCFNSLSDSKSLFEGD